ncbi:carboxypeptidase-like regulatory domain-containing protein [Saccharicrinis sp. FJH54]|uniref:carboxypeptidase-like regulatory domain-containing protein n=1 Tax=Saccharicrinis sp. FJH54 TaxID=3344665 RepID=UPI0035D4B0FA
MIKWVYSILFFLLLPQLYAQNADARVSLRLHNNSLIEVFTDLESQTGFKFVYRDSDLPSERITYKKDSIDFGEALEIILTAYSLNYTTLGKYIFVLKDVLVTDELSLLHKTAASTESDSLDAKEDYLQQRVLNGIEPDQPEQISIGKPGGGSLNKVLVRGRVTSADTGEPLIGVSFSIQNSVQGAVSDFNGIISLSLYPGNYAVRISSVGFESQNINFNVLGDGQFSVEMYPSIISLKEIKVKRETNSLLNRTVTGLEQVELESIRDMPVLMGERDILKSSQLLPGIVTVGEGSAGLNVRGGNADQNMFLINGLPVYNTSHLLGFFSAFNSDALDNFNIYKGNLPVKYGGRLSSVFDITTREGNRKQFKAHGGISPVSVFFTAESPVVKDKSAILFSNRITWSDVLLKQVKEPDIRDSEAGFGDFLLSYNQDFSDKNNLRIFAYYSKDNIKIASLNQHQYSTLGSTIRWNSSISRALKLNTEAVAMQYTSLNSNIADKSSAYTQEWGLGQYQINSQLQYISSKNYIAQAGISSILYNHRRGDLVPFNTDSHIGKLNLPVENGLESAVYGSVQWNVNQKLSFNAGLRVSFYQMVGGGNVLQYAKDAPPEGLFVTDTLHFRNGEISASSVNPEPRFALTYKPGKYDAFKFSYNRTSQYIFMLSNTVAIAPGDQWKLSDYHIKPLIGDQVNIGFYKTIPWYGLETSVELFARRNVNIPEYIDGADFKGNEYIEQVTRAGTNTAYGAEFLLKKKGGRFNGWLSYTYSRSFMEVNGENNWEDINYGIRYPANFDRPHVLNLATTFRYNRRFMFSGNFVYNTGRPVTLPEDLWFLNGISLINYSDRNHYRIPDYIRTDLSLSIEGNLKKQKFLHSSWLFNVYNVFGRDNIYSIFFKNENGRMNGYTYSVISVPVFTVSWIFKLGNYAN